jgi:dienelactone hydrolase
MKFYLLFSLILSGCIGLSSVEIRHIEAEKIADKANWSRKTIDTDTFTLTAFTPPRLLYSETLRIYIEGDGLAWINANTPSFDPTPINSVALKLALKDPSDHAVYLARPCQYARSKNLRNCNSRYWTTQRFSQEVITSTNQAISKLKQQFNAKHLILIGFSGGGAIATLAAVQRNDVIHLITIAGNLNTSAWTAQQHLSPLSGSLNPADFWQDLISIPQTHYIGALDNVITPELTKSYQDKFPLGRKPTIIILPDFDHHCCWVDSWSKLITELNISKINSE